MFCKYCGKEIPDGMNVCAQCGQTVNVEPEAGEGEKEKKGILIPVMLGIVVALLFIIIGLLLWFIGNGAKSSEGDVSDIRKAEVGDIVKFGSYEQDTKKLNGAEAIEWMVLDKQGDSVLLLSKYILDAVDNKESDEFTWETCMLRGWLNDEFYNTAFSSTEQGYIRQVTLENPDNPYDGTEGGNATTDKVFLLSLDELKKYFSFGECTSSHWKNDDARLRARITKQAYKHLYGERAPVNLYECDNICFQEWWLRSPSHQGCFSACVSFHGGVDINSHFGNFKLYVRPAIWLNLNP